MFKGLSHVAIEEMFTMDENKKGTRGHCLKLRKTQCTRDITRHFFLKQGGKQMEPASSLSAFMNRLSWITDNWMGFFMD